MSGVSSEGGRVNPSRPDFGAPVHSAPVLSCPTDDSQEQAQWPSCFWWKLSLGLGFLRKVSVPAPLLASMLWALLHPVEQWVLGMESSCLSAWSYHFHTAPPGAEGTVVFTDACGPLTSCVLWCPHRRFRVVSVSWALGRGRSSGPPGCSCLASSPASRLSLRPLGIPVTVGMSYLCPCVLFTTNCMLCLHASSVAVESGSVSGAQRLDSAVVRTYSC